MTDDELRRVYDSVGPRSLHFNASIDEGARHAAGLRAVFEAGARAQWIPVGERLPDEGGYVLAAWNNQDAAGTVGMETMAAASVRRLAISAIDEGDDCFITHWMPLPAAPLAKVE